MEAKMATDNRKIEKLLNQMKDTQSTELATQAHRSVGRISCICTGNYAKRH